MTFAKVLAALVLTASAAIVSAAEGDPPAVVGRLSHVSGQVSFAPAQSDEEWVAASLNRPITTGDRLWTDGGSRAEMHVGSLAVRMDEQTSLDVLNLDDRGLQLRLAQGSANVRVRHAAAGEPVEIATPGGAVVITRPGAYRVNVDPQGTVTWVSVRGGGQAEVFALNGSFVIRDGEQARITGSREDVAMAPPPDEFDRWAASRDRREDRLAATRYVPPAMTGYEDLDQYGTWRTVPQYGAVWQPTAVPAGWAPYRYGHWVWIAPWGWTWVDDEPWGFAPSHYGRWIWLGRSWAWAPGRIVARPVYAPALVAFIGGPNFSVSIGAGSAPAVGWVPLGWQEPYRPWYRASHAHVREVNITHVTNVTNITSTTNVRYVNRGAPSGVTVVSRENFAGARPLNRAALRVSPQTVAAAPVTAGPPVATPSTASLAQARPGARPPAEIRRREAVAVSAPPQSPARVALADKGENRPRAAAVSENERPRVRVIDRRERVNPAQAEPRRAAEQQVQGAPPAAAADGRERAAGRSEEARRREANERRTPAPPPDIANRPTFDRSGRMQAAPQPESRSARGEDAQRDAKQEQHTRQQRQLAEQESQRQAVEEQRAQRQQERQAQQRAQAGPRQDDQAQRAEQQARQRAQEQAARQQERQAQRAQAEHRQDDQARRADQQAQQRAQEQITRQQERQAQQRAQAEARQHEQAQRAEQQARQRAQEQAVRQQQERQAQQRAQAEARQHDQAQRAEQQARQRAQEQAVRQQQRAQAEARQNDQARRAEQQAQQQMQQQAREQPRQQRRESSEKGGRERPRTDKSEKG